MARCAEGFADARKRIQSSTRRAEQGPAEFAVDQDRQGVCVRRTGWDENGDVFHTYSAYARGLDILVGTYNFLDFVPKGRDENPDSTMDWVRRHDQYPA